MKPVSKIRRILSENYVRPDESEKIKSKIRENGEYTVIDKVFPPDLMSTKTFMLRALQTLR